MEKSKLLKAGLSALGFALTIGATLINDKVKSAELEETVAKKVTEALESKVKES